MCGIAGIMTRDGGPVPDWTELERMLAVIGHRGPDDHGVYRDDRVGLGHARLSIIDPAGGAQPMGNETGTLWITFNGEIFNYRELRVELEGLGHRFRTASDTEVVLRAYEAWGEGAWIRFNGQFALAVRDRARDHLWLVRDRVGILPLYFAFVSGGVVFGSEVKALLASGRVAPAFSGRGLRQVFTAWAPVAPDTVFSGVEAVPPGCALRIDGRLGRHPQRYWSIDYESTSALSFSDAVEGLGECLDRAITLRLRADVPVGAYLSGGLDSSLITRRVHEIQGAGFSSFSIRFRDQRFDEGESQAIMTARLQSRHHEVWCGGPDIASALPDVVWHTEMPMLRTSPVPLFHLSGLVRDHSMKVVLTGEGADELLGGYNIFREARLREFCSRQPESEARVALFQRLYPYVGSGDRRSPDFWRGFFGKGFRAVSDPYYSHRIRWANTAWSLRFLAPDLQGAEAEELESAFDARLPSGWAEWPLLSRAQAVEMEGFMSGYLLAAQGDRVAMAHGVEVRYPFLDPDVVDFCLRLPATHRLRALSDKRVLRALAARELPPEIWDRPKQPYRAPIGPTLFGGEAADWIGGATDPAVLDSSGLFSESAEKLFAKARKREGHMSGEREEMALVGMLTLGLLHKNFVEDFDSRAKTALDRFRARPDRPRHDWSAAAVEQMGEKAP